MRYSRFFAPTRKDVPKDVTLKSHEYLIRAGYIQQLGSGVYSFLPPAKRVLDKIRAIVKDEMDKTGALEVVLGFVTPSALWEESGRIHKYGEELLRFKDRKEAEFVLGPTHEEAAVAMVRASVKSYKQLPLHIYQIHLKFRDEIRPRFGLMRAREFVMKDGYSFHKDKADLLREFAAMESCYRTIFARLGLEFRVVEADSGAIGGSGSKEFMVLADSGEDTLVLCQNCDYAANIEAAKRAKLPIPSVPPEAAFAKFHTPDVTTIEKLATFFRIDSYFTIKAVVKKAIFEKGESLAFFFLRGCDNLDETKALNATGALSLADASAEEIAAVGLFAGFIGPYALKHITKSELIFFDSDLLDATNLICGANERDYHFVGVDLGNFEGLDYRDLAEIREGNACAHCGGRLYYKKGIEVGHIFQLGTRYSKPLGASFLDENAQAQFFEMGCYGLGITRILAASIEQHHDEKGIVWNPQIAPFALCIVVSNAKDSEQMRIANELYAALCALHIDVLFDEREERFGAKMADFELGGIPFALIVGKGIVEGNVEWIVRQNNSRDVIPIAKVVEHVQGIFGLGFSHLSTM